MSRKAGEALYSFEDRVDPKGPDTPMRDTSVSTNTAAVIVTGKLSLL